MATKKQTNTITKEKIEKIAEPVVETKVATKKSAPKKECKTTLIVEYCGKQVEDKTIIASVKKAWTNAGHKVGEIKSMELYIKPEDDAVYYVINGSETGKIEL